MKKIIKELKAQDKKGKFIMLLKDLQYGEWFTVKDENAVFLKTNLDIDFDQDANGNAILEFAVICIDPTMFSCIQLMPEDTEVKKEFAIFEYHLLDSDERTQVDNFLDIKEFDLMTLWDKNASINERHLCCICRIEDYEKSEDMCVIDLQTGLLVCNESLDSFPCFKIGKLVKISC